MSTRSRIGIASSDGGDRQTITSIYCHFDGYPEGVGAVLADHYTDAPKVLALLALGDLSILSSELGEAHDFDNRGVPATWTKAYGRDRGEKGVDAKTHGSDDWPDSGQEYEYLYAQRRPNETECCWFWRSAPYGRERSGWLPLEPSPLAAIAQAMPPASASEPARAVTVVVRVELPADASSTPAQVADGVKAALSVAQEDGSSEALAYSYFRVMLAEEV